MALKSKRTAVWEENVACGSTVEPGSNGSATVFRLKRMQIVNPYNLFPALGLNWFQQNGTHNRLDFQFL